MNFRLFIKGAIFLMSLALAGFVLSRGIDENWVDTYVRGQGISGELIFLAVAGLLTAMGFPRQIVSFLGGYAFGFFIGLALAVSATALGCSLTFTYARLMGRNFIQRKFPRKIKRVDDFLSENPFSMTLLIRLLPVGNNMITSAAAGVSSVRAFPFIAGSFLGYIPQTAVFALAGSGVDVDTSWRVALSIVMFVISGILGVLLYRRYRKGKTLGRDIETSLTGSKEEAEIIVSQSQS